MKPHSFIFFLSLIIALPALAVEEAIVVRQATVYAKASSTSGTVGRIDAGARVNVFSRKGGWKEIFSDEKEMIGWVRSFQVREGNFAPAVQTESEPDSRGFLSGLASFSRRASSFFKSDSGRTSSGTATIGVRGLSEEEIKSAVADFEELEKMKGFASNNKRVSTFASAGKLKALKIGHISGAK